MCGLVQHVGSRWGTRGPHAFSLRPVSSAPEGPSAHPAALAPGLGLAVPHGHSPWASSLISWHSPLVTPTATHVTTTHCMLQRTPRRTGSWGLDRKPGRWGGWGGRRA